MTMQGRKFSIQGLLTNEVASDAFNDGTLVIFRLAPQVQSFASFIVCHLSTFFIAHLLTINLWQDYHRFHFPVSGIVEKFVHVPGCLYTVSIEIYTFVYFL